MDKEFQLIAEAYKKQSTKTIITEEIDTSLINKFYEGFKAKNLVNTEDEVVPLIKNIINMWSSLEDIIEDNEDSLSKIKSICCFTGEPLTIDDVELILQKMTYNT